MIHVITTWQRYTLVVTPVHLGRQRKAKEGRGRMHHPWKTHDYEWPNSNKKGEAGFARRELCRSCGQCCFKIQWHKTPLVPLSLSEWQTETKLVRHWGHNLEKEDFKKQGLDSKLVMEVGEDFIILSSKQKIRIAALITTGPTKGPVSFFYGCESHAKEFGQHQEERKNFWWSSERLIAICCAGMWIWGSRSGCPFIRRRRGWRVMGRLWKARGSGVKLTLISSIWNRTLTTISCTLLLTKIICQLFNLCTAVNLHYQLRW